MPQGEYEFENVAVVEGTVAVRRSPIMRMKGKRQ
jgi:hypothetical protein